MHNNLEYMDKTLNVYGLSIYDVSKECMDTNAWYEFYPFFAKRICDVRNPSTYIYSLPSPV